MSNLFNVFVYGTLKDGQPNHHWFSKGGNYKLICKAKTRNKYPLIIASQYNIPFLFNMPGDGYYIHGELYEVDKTVLLNLDKLENHPNLFERRLDSVYCDNDKDKDKPIQAWIYFIKTVRHDLLDRQKYENYDSNGNHGLPFKINAILTVEEYLDGIL